MQRPTYNNPAPAHSPPLHHPVPQHVSTVPQLRSPPPPQPPSQPHSGYGYAGQQQGGPSGGGYNQHPAFGGFMNDHTAQMGFQIGKSAVNAGQEYVEQNLGRFVSVSALKHYFNVTNSYVVTKLYIVLFPWRHRPWSRKDGNPAPREDMNSPDMYIPTMALVTYILLSTLTAGLRGAFNPELLGYTATLALSVLLLELLLLKFGTFILSISSSSQLLDLVAYSGYKFVHVIVAIVLTELLALFGATGGWVSWLVFLYCFGANAFFLLRSIRYVLLPDGRQGQVGGMGQPMGQPAPVGYPQRHKTRRTNFLFVYSFPVQFGFMLWLSKV